MTNKLSSQAKYLTEAVFEEKLEKRLFEFGAELANTILAGVQRMFDQQNRINAATFSTKTELENVKQDLKIDIHEVKTEFREFKEEVKEFKSETTGRFADVMGELQTIREEQKATSNQLLRHQYKLDDHDREIRVIKRHVRLAT